MFNFDRFTRVATAAAGALVLSVLSIGAAIGPVNAADLHRTHIASADTGTQANG